MDLNRLLLLNCSVSDTDEAQAFEKYLPSLPVLDSESDAKNLPSSELRSPQKEVLEKEIVRAEPSPHSSRKSQSSSRSNQHFRMESPSTRTISMDETLNSEEREFLEFKKYLNSGRKSSYTLDGDEQQKENIPPPTLSKMSPFRTEQSRNPSPQVQFSIDLFCDALHLRLHRDLVRMFDSSEFAKSELCDFIDFQQSSATQILGEQIDHLETYMVSLPCSPDPFIGKKPLTPSSVESYLSSFGGRFMSRLRLLKKSKIKAIFRPLKQKANEILAQMLRRQIERLDPFENASELPLCEVCRQNNLSSSQRRSAHKRPQFLLPQLGSYNNTSQLPQISAFSVCSCDPDLFGDTLLTQLWERDCHDNDALNGIQARFESVQKRVNLLK